MSNSTPHYGPLYDPKSKIRNFRFEEDFKNICLNFLGTGKLYEDPNFLYYLGDDKEWRRPEEFCSRPIFIDGKPNRFDALQGELGDCWLVSAIIALTSNDELIKHVVPPDQNFDYNYIGAFHFRIWQLGTWYDVVVDDRLPVLKDTKEPYFVRSRRGDIFWAALLEKAYAKVCGTKSVTMYDSLEGGVAMTSLQDLSGGIIEKVVIPTPPPGTLIKWLLNEVFSKNALVCAMCYKLDQGLEDNHGYTITKIFKCSDDDPDYHGIYLVRLMNPWGIQEWYGEWSDDDYYMWRQIDSQIRQKINFVEEEDGEFWMSEEDFEKYFEEIAICFLGPGQYIESMHGESLKTWRTTSFHGEWIKNISAGGSEYVDRHANPQYRILLKWPENDYNRDRLCTVVIELTHRSKLGRDVAPDVAFYIYSLTKIKNPPMPLNQQFILQYDPIDKYPNFSMSDGRAYLTSMTLEPGTYCIVPCTQDKNVESQFLLRVFSESRVELWEYDTQISKSCPTEGQSLNEPNEGLQRLFNDIANSQKEIDWIGLKEILKALMDPKRSIFGMIATFFKFMRDVFGTFVSLRSSNDYETDDVVFSKDECRSMIAMLDDNHSGNLSFSEFSNLWNKICFWTKVYEQHRDETVGYVTVAQLRDALSAIGYDINKRVVHSICYEYANNKGNIILTDFILCGVTLETVLALSHKENVEDGNKITFTLEKWVKNTLIL